MQLARLWRVDTHACPVQCSTPQSARLCMCVDAHFGASCLKHQLQLGVACFQPMAVLLLSNLLSADTAFFITQSDM